MIIPATENVNRAEIEMVIDEAEYSTAQKNHYNNIPRHIRIEVGSYALYHSTKDALEKFPKQYPKFAFKRTSKNLWETLLRRVEITKLLTRGVDQIFYLKHCLKRRRMPSLAHTLQAL